MNVKELIEELSGMNPDAEIIMQSDGEGNGYSPLSGVYDEEKYVPENTWSGDVLHSDDAEDYYGEEEWAELVAKSVEAVVLVPVN